LGGVFDSGQFLCRNELPGGIEETFIKRGKNEEHFEILVETIERGQKAQRRRTGAGAFQTQKSQSTHPARTHSPGDIFFARGPVRNWGHLGASKSAWSGGSAAARKSIEGACVQNKFRAAKI
jgi:hypothetical protein